MTYAAAVAPMGAAPFLSTYGPEGLLYTKALSFGAPGSATYPAANRAYYLPIVVPSACTIYRFFWANGATASTNNIQIGIYNDNDAGTDGPGTSILLGTSTLASGANICQFDNVADTALPRGRYWLAIWCNGTTTTILRTAPSTIHGRMFNGYLESSLTGGLPATATPAQNTTPYLPLFGFTTVSSP